MDEELNRILKGLVLLGLLLSCLCCKQSSDKMSNNPPNILWIVLEDTAPLFGCYDETLIKTPNVDDLAKQGVKYENAFMPAPVCSPCRSSIITGVMSTTLGMHNHHSARTEEAAIYLPSHIKTIPEIFKQAGYFTFNNGKDDYNFTYDRIALYEQDYKYHPLYGKSGVHLDLSSLKDNAPFFGQIQLSGGKEIFKSNFKDLVKTPVDRSLIKLPPYLPNHPVIIEEYANHLDAIQVTDVRVGEIMQQLKESGVLENTIVFFFSDHGMRLTRNKQFLYEGGLKVPLIISDFTNSKRIKSDAIEEGLVSGIDLGPTSLALADIAIPEYIEGRNIFDDTNEREFVISTRDRCDFTIDRIRSVRSANFKYIRNFMTERPYTQLTYMDVSEVPFVMTMKQLHQENKLDSVQALFFKDTRPKHELYNLREDPFELYNLANNAEYLDDLQEHINILDDWMKETDDKGQYPENEENLKLMLGIWGDFAFNPEYDILKEKYKGLAGSQIELKNHKWKTVDSKN